MAIEMAKEDGLELTEAHWEIINFVRKYYENFQISPLIKILTLEIKKEFGKDKGNTTYLYKHFPDNPGNQSCRYAGIPKPLG